MIFDSIEDAWKFWVDYGGKVGFGVRKQYYHKNKNGIITSYKFVYCKEGLRKLDKRDYKTINPRPETRTNCQARLGIKNMDVPEHYILKRWIKLARSETSCNVDVSYVKEDVNLSSAQRYKEICPRLIRIAIEACRSPEAFTILCKITNELDRHMLEFQKNQVNISQVNEFIGKVKESTSTHNDLAQAKGFKNREGKKSSKRPKG
ncbi:hypothetical protein KIW84_011360 [Lathyrus oleraceus]|uniref:FAR1 domain-containing protein n=1 Tax=Pisum sativum TaxID=3888 RepID=A0A9D5GV01_PEA|nr:hypothetical protein KIW84_011360 [Pisum sativum]